MAVDKMITAAAPVVGGIIGAFGQKKREKRAHDRNLQYLDIQQKNAMAQMDKQRDDQMEIWNKTNYGAQVEHMKNAGLNVGLMYEGGGQGGQLGGSAGSNAGLATAQTFDIRQAAQESAMAAAQIANIKAQTEKTKAETVKTSEDTIGQQYQNEFDKVRNDIQGESKEFQIEQIEWQARKLMAEMTITQHDQIISENTIDERTDKIKSEAITSALMIEQTKAGTNLTHEQAKAITEQLQQGWESLEVQREGQEVSRENMEKLTETMLWQAGIQATGNIINSLLDIRRLKTPTMRSKPSDNNNSKPRNHYSKTMK